MKTVRLQKNSPTLRRLLTMAQDESVLLVAEGGKTYILEEADEFDREVQALGNSDRFMSFLENRAREKGTIPIERLAADLRDEDA